MTNSTTKPPIWFWIVSVIALLWNLMGVAAYLSSHFITEEMIEQLEPHQKAAALYDYPAWYTALFALAVFAGALGCIALLIRKKWAYILFVISFICATIQQIYYMVEVDGADKFMPISIIVFCIFLVWFSKNAIKKQWIS